MKDINVLIFCSNVTPKGIVRVGSSNFLLSFYQVKGTKREVCRSVALDLIEADFQSRLVYTDTTGDVINRIGRLIRDSKINISLVSVIIMLDNKEQIKVKFKQNGQLDIPSKYSARFYGYFDALEDNDLISRL